MTATEGGAAKPRQPINCDQVAWVMDALRRFEGATRQAGAYSALLDGAKMGCLLDVMRALNLEFEDAAAARNSMDIPEYRRFRLIDVRTFTLDDDGGGA